MSRKFNAGKRAHSLAFLMVTTSLWPLTLHAQEAGPSTELPAVEVTTTGTGAAAGPVSPIARPPKRNSTQRQSPFIKRRSARSKRPSRKTG